MDPEEIVKGGGKKAQSEEQHPVKGI